MKMKLIDQVIFKADCVEHFLRALAKKHGKDTFIIDVMMQPHRYQEAFDKWRDKEYGESKDEA